MCYVTCCDAMLIRVDVDRIAAFLHGKGVSVGMPVAVFMSNSPELAMTILALSKLGAVAGLMNSALRGWFILLAVYSLITRAGFFIMDELLNHFQSHVSPYELFFSSYLSVLWRYGLIPSQMRL